MNISRREFIKCAAGMAGLLGLEASGLVRLSEALAGTGNPSVIWLQGQSCTGCSVSLLNSIYYATVDEVLLNSLNMEYHPNIMAAAGDFAISAAQVARPSMGELMDIQGEWLAAGPGLNLDLNGDGKVNFVDYARLAKRGYILVIEGAIPTGANGAYCTVTDNLTMVQAMRKFASSATQIIAVGTCATFGGIPAGNPNPTQALSVEQSLSQLGIQKPLVNIPGCPMHPDWLVGTVIDLLTGQAITLDAYKRPRKYFPEKKIHETCPFKGTGESHVLGVGGCLKELGCRGPQAHADCHVRKWNNPAKGQNGVNWCIQAGSPCIGCTEPNFPDGMSPFYKLGG